MNVLSGLALAKSRTDHVRGWVAALPSMLKSIIVAPRNEFREKNAVFTGKADPTLRPLDHARDGFHSVAPLATYRPHTPKAKETPMVHVDHPLLSKNGKRLPIAAIPYQELNRRFWSQGQALYADALERKRAQALVETDTPIEEMTLDQLCNGDAAATIARLKDDRDYTYGEPLSESRRSWLELGAKALHLESGDGDDESSLEDAVSTPDVATYADVDERNQQHFGTAYTTLDPITAKQIDWEKRVRMDGQMRVLKMEGGKIKPDRAFPTIDEWIKVGRRALALLLPSAGSDFVPLDKATRLAIAAKYVPKFEAYVTKTIEYAMEEAPDEWHGHFVDSAGVLHFHGSARLSLEEEKYGPYHAVPQDRSELAIFEHRGSDEDVEYMMGCDPCDNDECTGWVPRVDPFAREDADPPCCDNCGLERFPSINYLATSSI